jgi:hypothetical protein
MKIVLRKGIINTVGEPTKSSSNDYCTLEDVNRMFEAYDQPKNQIVCSKRPTHPVLLDIPRVTHYKKLCFIRPFPFSVMR